MEESKFVLKTDDGISKKEENSVINEMDDFMPELSKDTKEENKSSIVFCENCGNKVDLSISFCPKCGHKIGSPVVQNKNNAPMNRNSSTNSILDKVNLKLIIGVVAALVVVIVAFVLLRGKQADQIVLNKTEITVKVDKSETLTYTIAPADTKNKSVEWSSSNETIAVVNNGVITGVNEGTCVITVSTKNNKTAMCNVTVKAGPDFESVYDEYCDSSWAELGTDGSYLSIDSNPTDSEYGSEYDAVYAIESINDALGLPSSVYQKMMETNSLDGRLSETHNGVSVSWKYHPDNGMEILYEAVD